MAPFGRRSCNEVNCGGETMAKKLAPAAATATTMANGSQSQKKLMGKGSRLINVVRFYPIPCALAFSLLFFMGVEYTLLMVPPSSPPFDLGFVLTRPLHRCLADRPSLNTFLAALNTVFVGMQMTYILLWTLLVEGKARATLSALFMFTCRGIMGYSMCCSASGCLAPGSVYHRFGRRCWCGFLFDSIAGKYEESSCPSSGRFLNKNIITCN